MNFQFPWAFLLLALLPLVWWLRGKLVGKKRGAIRFSWTSNAAKAGQSLRQRLSFIPGMLRLLAIVLVVVAIARPQKGLEKVRDLNKGIAIEMVVDRSSSMGAEMVYDGQRMTRLDVVKKVFETFVLGDGDDLNGRSSDLVGMISFARYADTVCPLTLAHGALPRFLETVHLAQPRSEEDGTAIGDAVALAAARLKTAEEVMAKQAPDRTDRYNIESKVMILLTDGQQTAGDREPLAAAKLAKDWGIKIYTIAVGGAEAIQSRDTIFGSFLSGMQGQQMDTRTLRAIAEETGGRFFEAQNAEALKEVYAAINELERSEIESIRFMDYRELFLPFALAALLLVALEIGLNCTLFRKIP
ncbi:MAG: Ca-activated chloride channel family protein [Verrucomicrobiales bacterium]|jgi:Ca-activated chloride channel family protein